MINSSKAQKEMNDKRNTLAQPAFLALAAFFFLATWAGFAHAASSPWHETLGGKLRLIAGGTEGKYRKAGLEIVLDAGWKTYWKVPGDAGIPPQIDASGSNNLKEMQIKWPVPSRFTVGGSQMLGYKDAIVFPLLVEPENPDRPVELAISANVGLCADLCVPLSADLSLTLPPGGSKDSLSELLIDRDLALAPADPNETFRIASFDQEDQSSGRGVGRLVIATRIPDGYGEKDLFVEGPEDWFLPLTKPLDEKGAGADIRIAARWSARRGAEQGCRAHLHADQW